jgi:hypothetical protein
VSLSTLLVNAYGKHSTRKGGHFELLSG